MLAALGRRVDTALRRGTDAAAEAAYATVLHARRVVGAVSVAANRVKRETKDLVWDYQDVATDLRRPSDGRVKQVEADSVTKEERPRLRVVGSDD